MISNKPFSHAAYEKVRDANDAIQDKPVGGYCCFVYHSHGKYAPYVNLDGDFDFEDIERLYHYMQYIKEAFDK